jgi:hypothetical protein
MTQQAPTRAERRRRPRCRDCGVMMRLFGIEAHPTIDRTDLLTYVCSHCDGLQTEIEPREKLKLVPLSRMVMPMGPLLENKAFDAETTRLLGSTFDSAWQRVEASDSLTTDKGLTSSMREVLAKFIIAMAEQGERNPNRLIESALFHLRHATELGAASKTDKMLSDLPPTADL